MPGSTPATSQLDWLISTTAMIVLSWSKATRDLLKSFGWGIRALHQLVAATMVPSPRRLPHTISPLEGDGFELPVPRVFEPSQFIRLLDTAFAFCRRDRRRIGDRSHLPQAERIGWAPDRCRLHTIQIWSRSLFTHLLGRAM